MGQINIPYCNKFMEKYTVEPPPIKKRVIEALGKRIKRAANDWKKDKAHVSELLTYFLGKFLESGRYT